VLLWLMPVPSEKTVPAAQCGQFFSCESLSVCLSVLSANAGVLMQGKKSQSTENPGDLAPEHLTGQTSLSVLKKSLMNTKEMV